MGGVTAAVSSSECIHEHDVVLCLGIGVALLVWSSPSVCICDVAGLSFKLNIRLTY